MTSEQTTPEGAGHAAAQRVDGPIRVLTVGADTPPPSLAADPRFAVRMIDPFGPGDALPADLADAEVLLSDVAPANLADFDRLRLLQLGSAGYQQLAGHHVADGQITVANASGVNDIPIAEWCILMMMTLGRDLPQILRDSADRTYRRPARYQWEVRGARVGIVGYGGIGRELARQCHAHGLHVTAMNRSPIGPAPARYAPDSTGDPDGSLPDRVVPWGNWRALLPEVDFLVLTAALNDKTLGLIGAETLELLPRTAFLLNPARAQLVDEAALAAALQSGSIAGAALDSHYREPMEPTDPTWTLPNTVVTPHISGSTSSPHYRTRIWDLLEQNLRRYAAGEALLNVVPPGDLPG